jgi:hypothetical protein
VTPERIDELRALLAKATPRPWSTEEDWTHEIYDSNHELIGKMIRGASPNDRGADVSLIVAAVNALHELLTDYENHRALAQRADRMREALREIADSFPAHGEDDAWIEGARERARKAIPEGT